MSGALRVNFPWHRCCAACSAATTPCSRGVERLLAAGASGEALVSVVPRDGVPAIPPPDELAPT